MLVSKGLILSLTTVSVMWHKLRHIKLYSQLEVRLTILSYSLLDPILVYFAN